MFPTDSNSFYDDYYTQYNTNMNPTTSSSTAQPRLSLDSGLGLTNDSIYSSDLNESQFLDVSSATTSEISYCSQSGPLESSPPTKWARVRTPPQRKKPAPEDIKQESFPPGFNLFSPPSRKKIKTMFTSPTSNMKTPESLRKSIRISSPSPFKVTFSKTPLKLSNNENVTGIHIGRTGTYYNKTVSGSASKKCLLPSKPDGFTFLGSPNSDVLDFPLQSSLEGFESVLSESSSQLESPLDFGDDSMDYHQYSGIIETGRGFERLSGSHLKQSNKTNLKGTSITRAASRNLLKSAKAVNDIKKEPEENPEIHEQPKKESTKKRLSVKSEEITVLKEAKEKEMKNWKVKPFETPKKTVPLFSGRWLVISTGRTLAQQELFADAQSFFKTHRPSVAPTSEASIASRPSIPTIARLTLFKHRYRHLRV